MAKYFFCNKFVNEMFLGCNIKNLFGSREEYREKRLFIGTSFLNN